MKNRHLTTTLLLSATLAMPLAWAGHDDVATATQNRLDYAKVTQVEPLYRYVRSPQHRKQCWNEVVTYQDRHRGSAGGTVAGAVIGGVIGNKIGKGHRDRHVATAVGSLIGAAVGHNIADKQRGRSHQVVERRCQRTTEYTTEKQIIGYQVEYRYQGHYYQTRMDHRPGRRIRVNVSVTPAE